MLTTNENHQFSAFYRLISLRTGENAFAVGAGSAIHPGRPPTVTGRTFAVRYFAAAGGVSLAQRKPSQTWRVSAGKRAER
jgi:hypothetical protein